MRKHLLTIAAGSIVALVSSGAGAATLDDVKAKGFLQCGINTGLVGFGYQDNEGNWQGFDIDYCRAVAAAIFGDADMVKYSPVTTATRFEALKSGEVDILSRNTTWTYSRDVDLKLSFAGVSYYDGQAFMAPTSLNISSATELNGASICIQVGTTTELNLADYFRVNNMEYEPVPIETNEEAQQAYFANRCDAYTTDGSGLIATKASAENPDDHVILPEIISKEPLGPLVAHGDDEWADVARWTLNVLVLAEEYGVTQANVEELAGTAGDNPEINRMLGTEGEFGAMLRLDPDWVVNVIKAVGNYGEIFERHLIPLGVERGLNAQYTDGGILYAPPYR